MADLPISELESLPSTIKDVNTLFVAQQGNAAYKVNGQQFVDDLAVLLQAHGGIKTIAKTSTIGLVDTYTITFVDNSTTSYNVTNGKEISSITTYYAASSSNSTPPSTWYTTMQTMTNANRYLWSYQHYLFNDGTSYDTAKTVVGVYGDKGDTGNTGAASTVVSQSTQYASSSSGTSHPTSGWSDNVPFVSAGDYLWTKSSVTFNDNTTTTWYSAARQGVDGQYGSEAFQVTLTIPWTNNAQTISNNKFEASGYSYMITPSGTSTSEFLSCEVYADDVTTNGQMTFHCYTFPSKAIVVNVLKVMVPI